MDHEQAIVDVKSYFDSVYADVKLHGSGRAKFVVITKGLRGAVISVADDEKSWFIELWSTTNLATAVENLMDETVVELRKDAIDRICSWRDG